MARKIAQVHAVQGDCSILLFNGIEPDRRPFDQRAFGSDHALAPRDADGQRDTLLLAQPCILDAVFGCIPQRSSRFRTRKICAEHFALFVRDRVQIHRAPASALLALYR